MSEERKPFAEVEEGTLLVARMVVADEPINGVPHEQRAAHINAAVEAREAGPRAKLRALGVAAKLLLEHMEFVSVQDVMLQQHLAALHRAFNDVTAEDVAAVSGDVACGLAFDLGVVQGTLHAVQNYYGPLLDVLNASGGQSSVMAVELARALGLYDTRERHLAGISDEELRDECRRRGLPYLHTSEDGRHQSVRAEGFTYAQPAGRRCRSTTIPQCTNSAMPGSSLCWQHGGDMVRDLPDVDPLIHEHQEHLGIPPALAPGEAVLVQDNPRHVVRIRNIDTAAGMRNAREELAEYAFRLARLQATPRMHDIARRYIEAYTVGGVAEISARQLARQLLQFEGLPIPPALGG